MLLKWIACYPEPGRYAEYLAEQRVWNRETFQLEQVTSYVMAGGPEKIVLLIEWPDQAAVDRFMAGTHERLMQEHDLGPSLRSYSVAYFEHVDDVGPPPDWSAVHPGETVVRHTICTVPPEAFDEFLAVQREGWSPGMKTAPGFLGGRIWRRRDDPSRVLLTSYFTSAASEGEELLILELWHNDGA